MNKFWLFATSLCISAGVSAQKLPPKDSTLKTIDLSEVIVRSTRATEQTGMAFTNVKATELRRLNLGQDLPFLLNQQPSVVVTSDAGAGVGYTGIRVRGTDPTRINVTLNGIPYNDSESQGVYWVNMPDFASSVSSIQIQRGVGTSTNGAGAFGATVNVNTLQLNREAFGEINTSGGSFNTLKTNVLASTGLLNNRFVIDARLSRITSDGFVDRASSNLRSFYVSGGYYANDNFVRLNVFSGKERTYQSWYGIPESLAKGDAAGFASYAERNGLSDATKNTMWQRGRRHNFYSYENEVDDYQQDHYQLISSFKAGNWRLNPTLHYTYGRGFYEQFRANDKFSTYGVNNLTVGTETIKRFDLVRQKWLDNHFYGTVFSADYEGTGKLSGSIGGGWNQYQGAHFGDVIWSKLGNFPKNYRWYTNETQKTDFNIYGKMYYRVGKQFDSYLDLQYRTVGLEMAGIADRRQAVDYKTTYSFFNPKVGFNYAVSKPLAVYASFAVGNKEPNRTDFVDNAPNVPRPENLQDLEGGIRYNQTNWGMQVNGYFMNYRDQLVLTGAINAVGESIRMNVPKSYRAGVEIQASANLSEKLFLSGNLTLSRNKIAAFTETIASYDDSPSKTIQHQNTDISFSPNVIAGGEVRFVPVTGLEMSLLPKYVGKQYLDNTSNESRKLDAFFVNDLRFSYSPQVRFANNLTFSLLINHVLNHQYESNGYTYSYIYGGVITENFVFPQAGRNFLAGIRLRF